jgi:hypothetical protein
MATSPRSMEKLPFVWNVQAVAPRIVSPPADGNNAIIISPKCMLPDATGGYPWEVIVEGRHRVVAHHPAVTLYCHAHMIPGWAMRTLLDLFCFAWQGWSGHCVHGASVNCGLTQHH